jgi:gas vesicle protein
MTTISTSSLSPYSAAFTATIKKDDAATTDASTDATTAAGEDSTKSTTVEAGGAAGGGGATGSSTSDATQESIDKLQEQIKETQDQLKKEQQKLAAAQNGNGTEEEKAQKALAIQAQISSTNATLASQQAALLQLTTTGGVDTTA